MNTFQDFCFCGCPTIPSKVHGHPDLRAGKKAPLLNGKSSSITKQRHGHGKDKDLKSIL